MSQLDDDLLAVFADESLTVPVQYGAQPATRGIFTRTDEELTGGEGEDVVGDLITVEIIASSLAELAFSAPIIAGGEIVDGTVVGGENYTIQDFRRIEDGKLIRLFLATAVTSDGP